MSDYYTFDCGCKVKQFGTDVKDCDGLPQLEIDYYNLPECPMIWDYFCQGNTKGVFQLETNVGKSISKNLGPRNLEELSAMIALMRPGCANSMSEGKSMTDHYIDRKHNREPVKNIDDAISDLLEDTYQVLVFQEQSIAIAVKIAGFSPVEADTLRKSIGTKDAEMMSKVESVFIEGCKKVGLVSEQQAKNIFEMIRSSNRYAFNRCLSPETIVETKDGYRTLDELQIGDQVTCPSTELSLDLYTNVVNKYENGVQELYEVTLESGKTIECTLTHKFLCQDGQIRELSSILCENHRIMCQND